MGNGRSFTYQFPVFQLSSPVESSCCLGARSGPVSGQSPSSHVDAQQVLAPHATGIFIPSDVLYCFIEEQGEPWTKTDYVEDRLATRDLSEEELGAEWDREFHHQSKQPDVYTTQVFLHSETDARVRGLPSHPQGPRAHDQFKNTLAMRAAALLHWCLQVTCARRCRSKTAFKKHGLLRCCAQCCADAEGEPLRGRSHMAFSPRDHAKVLFWLHCFLWFRQIVHMCWTRFSMMAPVHPADVVGNSVHHQSAIIFDLMFDALALLGTSVGQVHSKVR